MRPKQNARFFKGYFYRTMFLQILFNPLIAKDELSRPIILAFYRPGPQGGYLGGPRPILPALCNTLPSNNQKSKKSVKILALLKRVNIEENS